MVTILVGKDETPFTLHRTQLVRNSLYFREGLALDQEEDNDDETPARLPKIEAE
jgi:hypothetical protein